MSSGVNKECPELKKMLRHFLNVPSKYTFVVLLKMHTCFLNKNHGTMLSDYNSLLKKTLNVGQSLMNGANSITDFGILGWVSRRARYIIYSQFFKAISLAASSYILVSLNTS